MHNSFKEILGDREDAALILEKLLINSKKAPDDLQKEAIEECLSLMTKGASLEDAAVEAIKAAKIKQDGHIVKASESGLSVNIAEEIGFDQNSGVEEVLNRKAEEWTYGYDPATALTHVAEGMIERGRELSSGLTNEQKANHFRKMGRDLVDRKMAEKQSAVMLAEDVERIFAQKEAEVLR